MSPPGNRPDGGSRSDSSEERHQQSLPEEAQSILEQARLIMPGIQTLFGFQLIAVFNEELHFRLSSHERLAHLVAIGCIVVAAVVGMTPAAFQRLAEPHWITHRFVHLSSRFITAAMFALGIALSIDLYLVTRITTASSLAAGVVGSAAFIFIAALWVFLPLYSRRRRDVAGRRRQGSNTSRASKPAELGVS